MNNSNFESVLNFRLEQIQKVLGEKAKEYVRNNDRLYNFNVAARVENKAREEVIWGMALKHYVSVIGIIEDCSNDNLPDIELVNEKIGDLINYLILLECSIKDKIHEQILQENSNS